MGPETVRKWIHQGELSAVGVRQGRLFVDRRELAALVKRTPEARHEDVGAGPKAPTDDGAQTAGEENGRAGLMRLE